MITSGAAVNNIREWRGQAHEFGEGLEPFMHPHFWKVENGWMKLSRAIKWRFTGLINSYENLVGTLARDIMVYSDLVDTSIVGNQRHQLLRKVRIKRLGEGRGEVIEVELALPTGELVHLSPGQTIATLGIRKTASP